MYQIKTSDFFNHTLDKELRDIDIVWNLSDDSFATGSSILYAIYSSKYKKQIQIHVARYTSIRMHVI